MVNATARAIPTVYTNLAGFGFAAMYPSWRQIDVAMADFRGAKRKRCVSYFTLAPPASRHSIFLAAACGGNGMSNLSQPPLPTEPDMALLFLGSLFETLDYTLPPERDEAKLDALAWHILDKRPKTLL